MAWSCKRNPCRPKCKTYRVDPTDKENRTDHFCGLKSVCTHRRTEEKWNQNSRPQHGQVMLQSQYHGGQEWWYICYGVGHSVLHGNFLVCHFGRFRIFLFGDRSRGLFFKLFARAFGILDIWFGHRSQRCKDPSVVNEIMQHNDDDGERLQQMWPKRLLVRVRIA